MSRKRGTYHGLNHVQNPSNNSALCTKFGLNHVQNPSNNSAFCTKFGLNHVQSREKLTHFAALNHAHNKNHAHNRNYTTKTTQQKLRNKDYATTPLAISSRATSRYSFAVLCSGAKIVIGTAATVESGSLIEREITECNTRPWKAS